MAEAPQRDDEFGLKELIESGLIPRERLEASAERRFARWEAGADLAMDVLHDQMTTADKTLMNRYGETTTVPDNAARRQAAIEWLKRVPGAEPRRAKVTQTDEGPRELVIRGENIPAFGSQE